MDQSNSPEAAKRMIMMMVKVSMVVWAIGFVMVLSAIALEFAVLKPALQELGDHPEAEWKTAESGDLADKRVTATYMPPMLMTLKLGGLGFILSAVFISLVAIVRVLAMMPDRLGAIIASNQP